jgi:hypothetical protein
MEIEKMIRGPFYVVPTCTDFHSKMGEHGRGHIFDRWDGTMGDEDGGIL